MHAWFPRYSTENDEWTEMSELQQKRHNMDAVVLNGLIFVIGGQNDGVALSSVECYDPTTNQWHFVADLNVARYDHSCCVSKGSIYTAGGENDEEFPASIERYDAQFDKWEIVRMNNFRNASSIHFWSIYLYISFEDTICDRYTTPLVWPSFIWRLDFRIRRK